MIIIPEEHQEYFFFGLKRGGNHCVINWILEHFESYVHYNNCFFKNDNFYVNYENEIKKKGKEPYEIRILSFEDRPIELEKKFNSNFEKISKVIESKKKILLLRDAYNTYASRYMKKMNPEAHMKNWNDMWTNYNDAKLWTSYAKEYLCPMTLKNNLLRINYNFWFSKKEYREELSEKFDRKHTDKGLQKVLENGGGSSFDKMKYNSIAQKMRVLSRYKNFINNKDFIKKIILNKEIKKLNSEIFGFHINFKHIFL